MIKPGLVAHADWGSTPRKRWMAWAQLGADDRYCVLPPNPVGDLATLFQRLRAAAGAEGCALLGVDFPVGLPLRYAERAGIGTFLDVLPRFGEKGRWERFYEVCGAPQDISLTRPFYPARPGGARRAHLLAALQADSFDALRRRCELPHPGRRAAAPLFWTLGGQQVGKAAIVGWRDLLGPALRGGRDDLAIWPFSGLLADLCVPGRIVVAESYPAECYGHLGIGFTPGHGRRRSGKRVREARLANAPLLLRWARQAGVSVSPALADMIRDGFGAGPDGEDPFDAVVGLFGMLNVVLGRQPPGEVQDARLRTVEGWILGQAVP